VKGPAIPVFAGMADSFLPFASRRVRAVVIFLFQGPLHAFRGQCFVFATSGTLRKYFVNT
jgi:hypothetical protein